MAKTYQFPALPPKCKACGLKIAGKSVELGAMRGSQPMGYCKCGMGYPLDEIGEPEPPEEPPEPPEEPPAAETPPATEPPPPEE